MENYTLFRTFINKEEIQELIKAIDHNSIDHKIQKVNLNLIPYLMPSTEDEYGLFIHHDDMPLIEKIIKSEFKDYNIEGHQLNDLNDEELSDLLKKQDEWSVEDILIAKRILVKRGKNITDKDLSNYKIKRLEELKKQKRGDKTYIILGFVLPVIGILSSWAIGFIGSIFYFFSYGIGFNYILDYKRLPTGDKVKVYDDPTRKIGLIIILWSVGVTILTIILLSLFW